MASKTIVLAAAIFLIICLVEPSTSECTLPCQIHPTRGSCACPADVGRKRRDVKEEDINDTPNAAPIDASDEGLVHAF